MGFFKNLSMFVGSVFFLQILLPLVMYFKNGYLLPIKADSWYYLGSLDNFWYFVLLFALLNIIFSTIIYTLIYSLVKENSYKYLISYIICLYPYIFLDTSLVYFDTPIVIYITIICICISYVYFDEFFFIVLSVLLLINLKMYWSSAIFIFAVVFGTYVWYKKPILLLLSPLIFFIIPIRSLVFIFTNKSMGVSEYTFPTFFLYHIIILGIVYLSYKKRTYLFDLTIALYLISLIIQRITPLTVLVAVIMIADNGEYRRIGAEYIGLILSLFIIVNVAGMIAIEPIISHEAINIAERNKGLEIVNLWDKGHAYNTIGFKTNFRAEPISNKEDQGVIVRALMTDDLTNQKELSELIKDKGLLLEEKEYNQYLHLAKYYEIPISNDTLFKQMYRNETLIYLYISDYAKGVNNYYLLVRGK